jgi:hypothetical protein
MPEGMISAADHSLSAENGQVGQLEETRDLSLLVSWFDSFVAGLIVNFLVFTPFGWPVLLIIVIIMLTT